MKAILPLEIIDLILLLSLDRDDSFENDAERLTRSSEREATASLSYVATATGAKRLVAIQQAIAISLLSRHHRAQFQIELYRHVTLLTLDSIAFFHRTLSSRSDLGSKVQSLAILSEAADGQLGALSGALTSSAISTAGEPAIDSFSAADAVLLACPNTTHLLINCNRFRKLSNGVYSLHRPKEVTLVNVHHPADLDGIVTRHRDLTAAALQNDPRIQAILGSGSAQRSDQAPQQSNPPASSIFESPEPDQSGLAPQAERSLSHLHLVHFDGRLLHHLATVSSLTHLVLTHPMTPETRPGVPGLSVIPRSHLMLLLGSGNIARIIIRASLATCLRLMEELAPIEDRKLVFRPIRMPGDPLFPDQAQRLRTTARLGDQAAALYEAVASSQLDVLAEFYDRVRLHQRQAELPASSADPDSSRDSSGRTSQGRSSESSGGGTSGSVSTGWGDEEDAGPGAPPEDDGSDDLSEDDLEESDDAHDSSDPAPAQRTSLPHSVPTAAVTRSINAPPLNIPIEELLRAERFLPAGLVGRTPPSQSSSSASPGVTSSSSSSPRRSRQRIRRAPFVLRRTDLRGATQSNIDVCAELYEALAADAGLETEMHFW